MKRINPFAGVLFLLVGFSAGVGFNLFSTKIEAQGRPENPPRPLTSVAHDATLTGDGTTNAPLGVANGAVTAGKLSTAAVPSVGQVLGFNGANLAWQDAATGSGGVRVVDSLGKVVGPLAGTAGVWMHIEDFDFLLSVGANGFQNIGSTFFASHTTTDCSGARYFLAVSSELLRRSQNSSAQLFYAADPVEQLTIQSLESVAFADPSQPGPCQLLTQPGTASVGLLRTLDLSTLGMVPPFHLEF